MRRLCSSAAAALSAACTARCSAAATCLYAAYRLLKPKRSQEASGRAQQCAQRMSGCLSSVKARIRANYASCTSSVAVQNKSMSHPDLGEMVAHRASSSSSCCVRASARSASACAASCASASCAACESLLALMR